MSIQRTLTGIENPQHAQSLVTVSNGILTGHNAFQEMFDIRCVRVRL